ncbi:MAG: hypothetical protein AB7G11_02300 [Phycisphaerales bacterium]
MNVAALARTLGRSRVSTWKQVDVLRRAGVFRHKVDLGVGRRRWTGAVREAIQETAGDDVGSAYVRDVVRRRFGVDVPLSTVESIRKRLSGAKTS